MISLPASRTKIVKCRFVGRAEIKGSPYLATAKPSTIQPLEMTNAVPWDRLLTCRRARKNFTFFLSVFLVTYRFLENDFWQIESHYENLPVGNFSVVFDLHVSRKSERKNRHRDTYITSPAGRLIFGKYKFNFRLRRNISLSQKVIWSGVKCLHGTGQMSDIWFVSFL